MFKIAICSSQQYCPLSIIELKISTLIAAFQEERYATKQSPKRLHWTKGDNDNGDGEEVDHRDNNRSNHLKWVKMKDLVTLVMDPVTFWWWWQCWWWRMWWHPLIREDLGNSTRRNIQPLISYKLQFVVFVTHTSWQLDLPRHAILQFVPSSTPAHTIRML